MTKTRCVWAAALLVLGMAFTAAAAFGQVDAWKAVSSNFPSAMTWDEKANVSVDAQNTGTTTWDSNFSLRSVQGTTASAFEVDRWGTTAVSVVGTVAPGATYRFPFGITAPPISTLQYPVPFTPTTPPQVASLASDWMLADAGVLLRTDVSNNSIVIERFPDVLPASEDWAAPFIEELAGHVPFFVGGFPDGTYGPTIVVTRDQMAVFIARALAGGDENVPTGPAVATFPDVPPTYWAYKWVEFAVDEHIVGGYPDGTYGPTINVTRDQMAVFVSRGVAGGDENVPAGPLAATFPDVPTDYWAFKYVEFAVDHGIVGGYPDGEYKPVLEVTRDQMAVFVYRSFVMPSGSVVVLAGPAITRLDPPPASYDGWSTVLSGVAAEAGTAYIGLDAARLTTDMAPITVNFELREEDGVTSVSSTQVIDAAAITAAKAAVVANGGAPYFYVVWDIDEPALPAGNYLLTVTINGNVLSRRFPFVIQ